MCGIAGLISVDPARRAGPMLEAIGHRGRDDEGVWTSASVDAAGRRACLGHRRLAIIDTSSAGHQPMLSEDGRYSLTFNGEIYNYRELRARLESLGREFRTDTDTEVLLAAFAEWGEDCLRRLNGMFAFAVTDEGRGEDWWRERVLETLDRVVGMEMVADVPLGSFLSGGVDSSVIVAMMNHHAEGRRVSTYTIGIEEEDLRYDIIPSDVPWARRVAELLGTDYHETMLRRSSSS